MNNYETDQFLDAYRRLETAAEKLVGSGSRSSSIMRLAHLPEFQKYRDELDYCRQVRNLLTHEAKIDGQYGVFPSQTLQQFINKMLKLVEDPPVVGDVMTPVNRLLPARLEQPVLDIMDEMNQRGISHVPIVEQGVVTGIFSIDTVFMWVLEGHQPFTRQTLLQEVAAYLSVEQQMGHGYCFVDSSMPVQTAKDLFERAYDKNRKIKLLLVTRGGRRDEKLLGVISPYDLLDDE